jgi:hypothetical protein
MRERHISGWRVSLSLAAALCVVCGCGSEPQFRFDELDTTPIQDELREVSLGKYVIPIPVLEEDTPASLHRRNLVQFDFELIAVVDRDDEPNMADSWERHQGKIRDRVIRVCRNSSIDDLDELRAHLMDAVQSQLGTKEIRQLVIAEVKSRQL